jgi:hypothetical protein
MDLSSKGFIGVKFWICSDINCAGRLFDSVRAVKAVKEGKLYRKRPMDERSSEGSLTEAEYGSLWTRADPGLLVVSE